MSRRREILGLLALIAVQLAGNGWWLRESVLPVAMHNLHGHLEFLHELEGLWRTDPAECLHRAFLSGSYYPPLLYVATSLARAWAGPEWLLLFLPGLASLVLLILATHLIGRRLFSPATGLLGATLVSLFPIVLGLTRTFDPVLPAMALGTAALAALLASDGLRRPGPTVLAALLTAGSLLTNRVIALFYLAGPWVMVALEHGREGISWRSVRKAGLIVLCLAGPFYGTWAWHHLGDLSPEGRIFIQNGVAPSLWRYDSLLYYLLILPDNQIHVLATLALLASLPVLGRAPRRTGLFLVLWALLPVLVFSFIPKKDPPYTLHALPAVALIIGHGLITIRRVRLRQVLTVLLVLAGIVDAVTGSLIAPPLVRGTRFSYDLVQVREWLVPPLRARSEMDFLREVVQEASRENPEGTLLFADFGSGALVQPAGPFPTSEQNEAFVRCYDIRSSVTYWLRLTHPRIEAYSSLWPQELGPLIERARDFHRVLVFSPTAAGGSGWIDPEGLERLEERMKARAYPEDRELVPRIRDTWGGGPKGWEKTGSLVSERGFTLTAWRRKRLDDTAPEE